MLDPERKKFFQKAFQPVLKYRDAERSPFVVTSQTYQLLQLLQSPILLDRSFGSQYLSGYTMLYLKSAGENCGIIFDRDGQYKGNADLESREATNHAYAVFGSMPGMTALPKIPALKDGFSKRGMLKAPESKSQYLARIREIKIELANIAAGSVILGQRPVSRVSLFRTLIFFRVAHSLTPSSKLTPREKELREKHEEVVRDILAQVDLSQMLD